MFIITIYFNNNQKLTLHNTYLRQAHPTICWSSGIAGRYWCPIQDAYQLNI